MSTNDFIFINKKNFMKLFITYALIGDLLSEQYTPYYYS